jgi:GTPase
MVPLPKIALVGRANVGKSTLFNRICGRRKAITDGRPGSTRDRNYAQVSWQGAGFELIDTGGLLLDTDDPLLGPATEQAKRAIEEADVVLLVVDARAGLLPDDAAIARELRRDGKRVLVAVNKVEGGEDGVAEFAPLGFDRVLAVSAEHGQGVGDLLDAALEGVPRVEPTEDEAPPLRLALVGRPNVGKSSLVNRLLREERMLVSDMPGTTRDAIDAVLKWHKREFRIVDTAGIRRPGRVARSGQVESLSVLVARRAIEKADVVVLVVDATIGATDQDAAIAGEADKQGRGVIVVANKWDLVKEKGPDFSRMFDEELRRQLKFLDYATVLHISAATGERTPKLLEAIDRVADARQKRVPTPELNRFVQAVTAVHPPASPGRKQVRVLYAAQTGVAPPTFVFFTNVATAFHFSYERFLVNQIRDAFGFAGSPIRVQVRRRGGKENPRSA